MKVKQILSIKEIADDKRLPCDMHDLDNHYYPSESHGTLIKLADMDIVHLVRAFKKGVNKSLNHTTDAELSTQNDDLVNANKNLGNRVDYLTKGIQDGFISGVDDLEKIEQLEKDKQRLSDRIDVILKENEEVHLETHRLVQQLEHDEHQVGKIVPLVQENLSLSRQRDSWKEKAMNMMEKSSYDELTKVNAELKFQIEQVDRNQTVSKEAYDIAWDNNKLLKKELALMMLKYHELFDSRNTEVTEKVWQKKYDELNVKYIHDGVWKDRYEHELKMAEYWKDAFYKKDVIKGHGYVFSEIPNDCDGKRFTDDLKKYLNKESYKLRVRGQYLDEKTKKAEGWRPYEYGQPMDKSKCLRVYVDIK